MRSSYSIQSCFMSPTYCSTFKTTQSMAFSPGYELTPLQKEHNDWPSQYLNFLSLLISTANGHNYRSIRLFLSLSWMLQYSFCYMFQFFWPQGMWDLSTPLWVVLAFSPLFLDFAHFCPIGYDLTFRLYISSKWIFQYFTVLNYLNSKFRVQKEHDENMGQTFFFQKLL